MREVSERLKRALEAWHQARRDEIGAFGMGAPAKTALASNVSAAYDDLVEAINDYARNHFVDAEDQ